MQIPIADWQARHPADPPGLRRNHMIGEKLEPYRESIERIKAAYQLAGYQYAKELPKGVPGWRAARIFQSGLEFDRDYLNSPDEIRLTKQEADIVDRLCKTPRFAVDREGKLTEQPAIPFDPRKRTYRLSEILPDPQAEASGNSTAPKQRPAEVGSERGTSHNTEMVRRRTPNEAMEIWRKDMREYIATRLNKRTPR